MDGDPFAPLGAEGPRDAARPNEDNFEPLPVPDGIAPPARHWKLGRYSHRWPYTSTDGALQGYVCRFATANGKEFRPLRYGRLGRREGYPDPEPEPDVPPEDRPPIRSAPAPGEARA